HYANPDSPCRTPALDALAADSLCFTNAYTTAPVCTPARSSLYSGLYPSVTGMCTNIYQAGCVTHEIADVPSLLSRRLQQQGYCCGYTGKWHLGLGKDKSASAEGQKLLRRCENGFMGANAYLNYGTLPTDVGFIGDDFPGHGDGGWETPQFHQYLTDNGLTRTLINTYGAERPGDHSRGGIITSGEETTVAHYVSLRARQVVDQLQESGSPFFLAMNFWGPHEPYYVPQEDYDLYRDLSIPPWPSFTDSKDVQNKLHQVVQRPEKDWSFFENNLRHYYAAITNIDRQIGRFLDHLRASGLYDDSYIIFCADHGDSQGCHNGMENKSGHLYDEITKIPLMIKPPRGMCFTVTEQFACTVDLYATILDIAALDQSCWQSGRSLLPLLQDPDTPVRDDVVTECVGAFPIIATQRMYRRGAYKYIFNCGGSDELYNLENDPYEMHNLIDDPDSQNQLTSMREGLADAMYRNRDSAAAWFCKVNHLREWTL
ncbi:MAG: sulfatase-like hydrolase/transferase, partial [Butyricicoccus sp.]